MNSSIEAILSLPFLFFCLSIFAISGIIKQIVGYFVKTDHKKFMKIWKELILPILPMFVGLLLALIKEYPYPDGWESSSSRFIFGLVAGLSSGLVYRVIKSFLSSKLKEFSAKK